MTSAAQRVNEIWRLTRWELVFLKRYQLVGISLFISVLYAALFFGFGVDSQALVTLAVFSDPVMLGFMFTGVLILYDRSQRTMSALSVLPIRLRYHLLARGIALTILAEICSMAIAGAGIGFGFNIPLFMLAVALNSLLYYYIGIICLAGADSFNAFIMRSAVMLAPLFLPLVSLLGIYDTPWFYLLPTMASILSFESAFGTMPMIESLYAFGYIVLSLVLLAGVAEFVYKEKLRCAR